MACCPTASSFVRHTEGRGLAQEHLTVSALSAPCDGSPMTVRGGGVPAKTTALMPLCRMGPPPRSSAADAHHCIMVWVFGPPHTRMWHDHSCTQPQLPSDVVIPTHASVPSCSEPSRTRPLRVALRAILDHSCARRLLAPCGSGRRNGLPGRTKKLRDMNMDRTLAAPP